MKGEKSSFTTITSSAFDVGFACTQTATNPVQGAGQGAGARFTRWIIVKSQLTTIAPWTSKSWFADTISRLDSFTGKFFCICIVVTVAFGTNQSFKKTFLRTFKIKYTYYIIALKIIKKFFYIIPEHSHRTHGLESNWSLSRGR